MNATNETNAIAVPVRPSTLTPTRVVSLIAMAMAGVVALLWGAIAMQGPPGNPYGPPQGGGYEAPPGNPYGPPPGPRQAPPPEVPNGAPASPSPPRVGSPGSSGTSFCTGSEVECASCMCDACVLEGLCEALSLCDVLAACSSPHGRARVGFGALAIGELLLPIAVLLAWRKRERGREAAA